MSSYDRPLDLRLDHPHESRSYRFTPSPTKRRTTVHQREVLLRLQSRSERRGVAERELGSHSALWHLFARGLAGYRIELGPRGGEHYYWAARSSTSGATR